MCAQATGRALNASSARWVPVDPTSRRASCIPGYEVMTGLCSSTASGCSGESVSVQCTAFLTMNFSRSATASETKNFRADSATVSSTVSAALETATLSREKSKSRRLSLSISVGMTVSRPALSESVSASGSIPTLTISQMTLPMTATEADVSPSESLTFSSQLTKTTSMTTRPPTMTPRPTVSNTLYDSVATRELILVVPNSRGGLTSAMIQEGSAKILAVLKRATWNFKSAPFIDRQITGSEVSSPFGWNEQKEATFAGIEVVPGNRSAMLITLKPNVCYQAEEIITFDVPPHFTTAGVTLRAKLSISGSSSKTDRRAFAISTMTITIFLLMLSALLGNQGAAVLMFMEIQVTTVLGSQSCSRANIRDYYDAVSWIVAPTAGATAFSFDAHFGVVLLHSILSVGFFIGYVMVCRMRKRARLFFPSLPLTFGYLTIIGATSHAWLDVLNDVNPLGWRVISILGWLAFVGGVVLTVLRIRSPRGLQFLAYAGAWKTVLSGTYFPQQLRSKYALLADMWNVEYMQYSSPVHLLHLSLTTVISAMSRTTIVGCFVVLSLQLTWQLVIMLLIVWNRPGRSLFHNAILITQACNQLLIVIVQVVSLDCGGSFPDNVNAAETIVCISMMLYLILAAAACIGIYHERGHRVRTQREAQDAEYKVREETLMLHANTSLSAIEFVRRKGEGFPILPNIKFHETNPRVSTDDSLMAVERQKRLEEGGADHQETVGALREDIAELREMEAVVRTKLWKEVTSEVEPDIDESDMAPDHGARSRLLGVQHVGPLAPGTAAYSPAASLSPVATRKAEVGAVQSGRNTRCRRCLKQLPPGGICSNCEVMSFL
jgi:hypothetical protein